MEASVLNMFIARTVQFGTAKTSLRVSTRQPKQQRTKRPRVGVCQMWIVELKSGPYVWLSDEEFSGEGDPPRTYLYAFAQTYEMEQFAIDALKWARTFEPFPGARIVKVDPNFE
jgi:hypothetical protein